MLIDVVNIVINVCILLLIGVLVKWIIKWLGAVMPVLTTFKPYIAIAALVALIMLGALIAGAPVHRPIF